MPSFAGEPVAVGSLLLFLPLVALACGSSQADHATVGDGGQAAATAGAGAGVVGAGTGPGGGSGEPGAGGAGGASAAGAGSGGVGLGGGGSGAGAGRSGGGAGASAGEGTAGVDSMRDPLVNPEACPAADPEEGTPCPELGLVCKYGEEPDCRSRWGCSQVCDPVCTTNFAWEQNFGKRDCPTVCPETEPSAGAPCDSELAVCTYGDDPACRSAWECRGGAWQAPVPARDCDGTVVCPAQAPVSLITCGADEVTPSDGRCVYENGVICACMCIWDIGGAMAQGLQIHWSCSIPSATNGVWNADCPLGVPMEGSACVGEVECSYPAADICEVPNLVLTMARCVSGSWELTP